MAPALQAVFACRYEDPYSHENECKEYWGEWTESAAQQDGDATFNTEGFVGTMTAGACNAEGVLGSCDVPMSSSQKVIYRFYDLASDQLAMAKKMCEKVLKGTWYEGDAAPDGGAGDPACDALETEALEGMRSNEAVTVDPECVDDGCVEQLASGGGWISFWPAQATPTAGLIFYPGGGVDPRLYAPILQRIAKDGYAVILVPMPDNSALTDYGRAAAVMSHYAAPPDWFLAGHSLGGVGVLPYVKENPTATRGFVHWAAYGTSDYDIHNIDLPGASIFGTFDGQSTVEEVQAGAAFLPPSTQFVQLDGANHAQFGHLCQSDTDLAADITRERQHALVEAATVQFMHRTLTGNNSVHAAFATAEQEANVWCQEAQRVIVNPVADEFPRESVTNHINPDSESFIDSSASIDTATQHVNVQTLLRQGANPSALVAPSIIEGDVWCKMKTQDAVVQALSLTTGGAQGSCAEANEAVLAWALEQVSEVERDTYLASGKQIDFLPDDSFDNSIDWLDADLRFTESTTSQGTYELVSPSLVIGDDPSAPAEKRLVFYCKLWAPARALLWVLAQQ